MVNARSSCRLRRVCKYYRCACVRAYVRTCVRACVRACVCMCSHARQIPRLIVIIRDSKNNHELFKFGRAKKGVRELMESQIIEVIVHNTRTRF